MKKKCIFVIVLLVVLCAVFVGCSVKGDNFVDNGNFETLNSDGDLVEGWTKSQKGNFEFRANKNDGADNYDESLGQRFAYISAGANSVEYENMFTKVKLHSGTTYKLSAMVNIESVSPNNKVGIKIGFKEDENFEGLNFIEKTDGWKHVETYFKSNTSKQMSLYMGFGDTQNKVSGTASFDNIVIEKVSSVPATFTGVVGRLNYGSDYSLSDAGSTSFVVIFALVCVALFVLAYFVIRKLVSIKNLQGAKPLADGVGAVAGTKLSFAKAMTSPIAYFSYLIVGAFLIRFLIVMLCYGMGTNITSLSDICVLIQKNSFLSIYTTAPSVNQPMGTTFILGVFGMIANATGIDYGSLGFSILVRMPSIIADIVAVYCIYTYASKYQGEKMALVYSGMYALLPIFFIFGSMYGSVQPIAISLLIAMFIAMLDKKYVLTGSLFTAALMFSNLSILALPAVLVFQITAIVKEKDKRLDIMLSMMANVIVFFAISMPLCWNEFKKGNIFFYVKEMYDFFASSKLLSSDTFGLYAMFGAANGKEKILVFEVLNWLFVIAMAAVLIYHYIKKQNRLDLIFMTSVMYIAFGTLGAGANLDILPIGLALMLLYLVNMPDRRLYWTFGGFATLSFINTAGLIAKCGYIVGGTSAKYLPYAANSGFLITFSIFTVALMFYLLYVAADILFFENSRAIQPLERTLANELKYIFSFKWFKIKRREKAVEEEE